MITLPGPLYHRWKCLRLKTLLNHQFGIDARHSIYIASIWLYCEVYRQFWWIYSVIYLITTAKREQRKIWMMWSCNINEMNCSHNFFFFSFFLCAYFAKASNIDLASYNFFYTFRVCSSIEINVVNPIGFVHTTIKSREGKPHPLTSNVVAASPLSVLSLSVKLFVIVNKLVVIVCVCVHETLHNVNHTN